MSGRGRRAPTLVAVYRYRRIGLASLLLGLPVVLGLTACGAGHPHSTTSTTATGITSTNASTGPASTALSETARVATSPTFAGSIVARPGEAVEFRTYIPSTAGSRPENVQLELSRGPSTKLTITATARGRSPVLTTVSSADGRPLTLLEPHYECALPPLPTFCPAKLRATDSRDYDLSFLATHETGVTIAALVGPSSLPAPKTLTTSTTVAPPYTVMELLRAHLPTSGHSQSASKPASTVSASAGEELTMYSELKGTPGARQPVTVTVNKGPGKTITVSAAVAGGQVSRATVRSASGTPIEIALARYTCFVAPTPTFCPASEIKTAPHRYELTFLAAPGTATIEIGAEIHAG